MKIAIIGAGIAGLAAGAELKSKGHEVIVLEAKNRIGGRIWTDREFANYPIELGAEFIHGENASSFSYLNKKTDPTINAGGFENFLSYIDGKWLSSKELGTLHPEISKAIAVANQKLPNANRLKKDMSVADWAAKLPVSEEGKARVGMMLSNAYLAHPEELSIRELSHEVNVETAGEYNFRLKNGYDHLPQIFAKDLDIRLEVAVTKVCLKKSGVEIKTNKGDFHAHKVIVAVPLSILQKGLIKFEPKLPEKKIKAIQSLRMGNVAKVHLKFKKAFWNRHTGLFLGGKHIKAWWAPGLKRRVPDAVFTGFAIGDVALRPDLTELALEDLSELFGSSIRDQLDKSKNVFWHNEPWIEGGYSFVPVGAFGARKILAAPVEGKIYFAGEATAHDSNPATVHGALDSGLRVAKEI